MYYEVVEDGTEGNYKSLVIWQKDGDNKKRKAHQIF